MSVTIHDSSSQPPTPTPEDAAPTFILTLSTDEALSLDVPTFRHLPKRGHRSTWVSTFTQLLNSYLDTKDEDSFTKFLLFPKLTLGFKRHSTTNKHTPSVPSDPSTRISLFNTDRGIHTLWKAMSYVPLNIMDQPRTLSTIDYREACITACREGAYAKAMTSLDTQHPLPPQDKINEALKKIPSRTTSSLATPHTRHG